MEPTALIEDDADDDRWNLKQAPRLPPPGHRPRTTPVERPARPESTPIERSIFEEHEVMKVRATTPPQAVASSINRYILDECQMPVLRAIGAGAVAQACKGIAIARGIIAVRGVNLSCDIGFDNIFNDRGEEISAQTFRLFLR
jgi:stage V sporulation protein S